MKLRRVQYRSERLFYMERSQADSQIIQDGIYNQRRYILAFRYRTEGLHCVVRLALLIFSPKKLHRPEGISNLQQPLHTISAQE